MNQIPPLYGLVLAGGKSQRMGQDKGQLEYHGMPQREYMYQLLASLCDNCFMSLRGDQAKGLPAAYKTLIDQDRFKGPFNGLLSAHQQYPKAAWLVVACDLPLLDRAALQTLIRERDPNLIATAFATRATGLPEPLAAIWEPGGLKAAMSYLQDAESSCPRKFLLQSDIKLVHPANDAILANANDPEEYKLIQSKLISR